MMRTELYPYVMGLLRHINQQHTNIIICISTNILQHTYLEKHIGLMNV